MRIAVTLLLAAASHAQAATQSTLQLRLEQPGILCIDTLGAGSNSPTKTLAPNGIRTDAFEELAQSFDASYGLSDDEYVLSATLAAIGTTLGIDAGRRHLQLAQAHRNPTPPAGAHQVPTYDIVAKSVQADLTKSPSKVSLDRRATYLAAIKFTKKDPASKAWLSKHVFGRVTGDKFTETNPDILKHYEAVINEWEKNGVQGKFTRMQKEMYIPGKVQGFGFTWKSVAAAGKSFDRNSVVHQRAAIYEAYLRYVHETKYERRLSNQVYKRVKSTQKPQKQQAGAITVYEGAQTRVNPNSKTANQADWASNRKTIRNRNISAGTGFTAFAASALILLKGLQNRRTVNTILDQQASLTETSSTQTLTVHRIRQKKLERFLNEHADTLAGPIDGMCVTR